MAKVRVPKPRAKISRLVARKSADPAGWEVRCPLCKFDPGPSITLDADDLERCQCSECMLNFTPQEARRMFAGRRNGADQAALWDRLIAWIQLAPRDRSMARVPPSGDPPPCGALFSAPLAYQR